MDDAAAAEIEEIFQRRALDLRIPGATLGVADPVAVGSSLSVSSTSKRAWRPPFDSLFQIGSVIKLLTATLEMQLVDDGLVDLDAPASEYLPGLRFGEGCTVRDLLTHSSGVDGDLVEDFGRGDDAIGRYVDARACRSEPQGSACRRSVRVVRMDARVQEPVCSTTLPSQWQARSASSTSSRPSRRGRPRSSSAFWTRYWAVLRWRKSWSAVAV
ncbi:MAG: hypothetical protein JWM17_147 [Actinobacteria bacterium]|nr:hypothetical protein [Actinomycetota bacterium]MCW3045711.1 hypothetical protein [Actinomycetota bacterium]